MKLRTLVGSLTLLGLASHAAAQTAPQRIEITGSSIKRLASESAIPLEIITEEELRQSGAVTAQDLLQSLGANSANTANAVSSNSVFGPDQDRLTGGGSFANLRGLGVNATLVLLNGRRIATHGMSGGAVDLYAIPMTAVARVEILKDGASAIYGTDAIGGVINFILKNNYNGVSLAATAAQPLASGGGRTVRASVTAGTGQLDTTGFNLMGSLTFDKVQILRGVDRDWATGYQPGRGLSPDTTSAPHANIIPSAGTALLSTGTVVGATDATRYTNLNLLAIRGQCADLPFGVPLEPNVQLWDKFGYTAANSKYRCGTDYGRQFMLRSPRESLNGVLRGTFKLGANHTAFAEVVGSKNENKGEFTPYQFSTTSNALTNYPVNGPHYLDMKALVGAAQYDPTKPIAYRLRMSDWGYRELTFVSENLRVAVGAEGDIGKYSYKVGLSQGQAKGSADITNGYADANKLIAALGTGIINPFLLPGQQQTQAAKNLIESTQVRGRVFSGKTEVTQVDATVSGELFKMPAGSLDFALGADARRESFEFTGSQNYTCVNTFTPANAALPNSVMGCPGNAASPKLSRSISAVFAELLVPVTQSLQLQLAVRHDNYDGFGGTTNPKIAFKFQPFDSFLVRGSVNTGFRAPTPQQVKLGQVELNLTGVYSDPVRCPVDATQCNRNSLPYRQGGNPDLKPETSQQGTLGFVFLPMPTLKVYADYWQVKMDDRIRQLSPATMIANYDLFKDNFIRDASGNVTYIQAGWVNAARTDTQGIDFGIDYNVPMAGGRLKAALTGTHMLSHKESVLKNAPQLEYVGEWTNTTLYLPWKLTASLGYKTGAWNTTASVNYADKYLDEDRSPYTANPGARREVAAYTTVNLFTTHTGLMKGLTLTGGIINLFDKDPSFTHHNADNVVGAGWDPRVADPRGRTFQFSARYDF